MIYVRSLKDRVAYEELGGRLIPTDRFTPVRLTPHIARLLDVHGDIELQGSTSTPDAAPAKSPKQQVAAAGRENKE